MSNLPILKLQAGGYSLWQPGDKEPQIKLWALIKAAHDKRIAWMLDCDYIYTLLANENYSELVWLNTYFRAALDGQQGPLRDLAHVSPKMQKQLTNSRDSAQRDLINNNSLFMDDLNNHDFADGETTTISDIAEQVKSIKRRLRQNGQSVTELYKHQKTKPVPKQQPKPVRTYTAKELAEFNKKYFKK